VSELSLALIHTKVGGYDLPSFQTEPKKEEKKPVATACQSQLCHGIYDVILRLKLPITEDCGTFFCDVINLNFVKLHRK
jgi:hypothetical protein